MGDLLWHFSVEELISDRGSKFIRGGWVSFWVRWEVGQAWKGWIMKHSVVIENWGGVQQGRRL